MPFLFFTVHHLKCKGILSLCGYVQRPGGLETDQPFIDLIEACLSIRPSCFPLFPILIKFSVLTCFGPATKAIEKRLDGTTALSRPLPI